MGKLKPLPYKRGMEVIYIRVDHYGIRLSRGTVTAVRNDEVVYVKTITQWGNEWKNSFGRHAGKFQENPYPLWMLQLLDGMNFRSLERRAKKASELYKKHNEEVEKMEAEVHHQAWVWESEEKARRRQEIPHGYDYLQRVASRMGFKKPRDRRR